MLTPSTKISTLSKSSSYAPVHCLDFLTLHELVITKVRFTIDGLSFTNEDYRKAKNILLAKYGRSSEVANTHIQNIMSLFQISIANPHKIHEFSENLQSSVQTLDATGKIKKDERFSRVT